MSTSTARLLRYFFYVGLIGLAFVGEYVDSSAYAAAIILITFVLFLIVERGDSK